MWFEHRAFTLSKDARQPDDHQDAWAADPAAGVAAIADGVGATLFSGRWAELLVKSVVQAAPVVEDAAACERWLDDLRKQWSAPVDVDALSWHQKPKFLEGAAATLLWVALSAEAHCEEVGPYQLQARAVGDCCLFHLRGDDVLRAFPLASSGDFNNFPPSLGSVRRRHGEARFERLDDKCWPGDRLILCTDAVAAWLLSELEAGRKIAASQWWQMSEDQWREWILRLREQRQMRCDDATLLLLNIGASPTRGESGAS